MSSRFSVHSSNHSGIPSLLQFPATPSLQFPVSPSLLRIFAGSTETDRSCGGDVEDEAVAEFDESPGTTNWTKFSVLQRVTWLTTTKPLIRVTVLFAKFAQGQHGRSILEQLHSDENMKIMHIHLHFCIRLDLPFRHCREGTCA